MAARATAQRIEIEVSDADREVEEAAAEALGLTLAQFYQRAARTLAETTLAGSSEISLTAAEADRFLDALDHPERFREGLAWLSDPPAVLG